MYMFWAFDVRFWGLGASGDKLGLCRVQVLGSTQGLLCSSFLGLLCFLVRNYNILPKKGTT